MKRHSKASLTVALVGTVLSGCERASTDPRQTEARQINAVAVETPKSIAKEHAELHEILALAASEAGDMAAAAGELEDRLAPHFKREEQIATPPLGLLPALVHRDATADMRSVLPMTDALERELPQMLREHEAIRDALKKFRTTAERNGQEDYVRFADDLAAHARNEEEILYPAAILIGRYVKRAAPR